MSSVPTRSAAHKQHHPEYYKGLRLAKKHAEEREADQVKQHGGKKAQVKSRHIEDQISKLHKFSSGSLSAGLREFLLPCPLFLAR